MDLPSIDDFDLLNALGSGSYSTVYRARHKRTKACVAVKSVAKSSLSKASADNLLQEIKILKTLKHKYIVEMVDFMWDSKNIYIMMELCEQGDLSAYIRQHRYLPESTCKFFLRQLAIALKYMREHEISHFDLKPHNLLLSQNPVMTLKVADFGFAQHLGLLDHSTTMKGSPLYMAPEIVLHRRYDPLADLWSIGVILYECLFGHAPYRSKTMDELMHKIQTKHPIHIPRTPSRLSEPCEDLLTRLLVHDPGKRIPFVDFFAHDFLDMKHEPTDENLTKAIELITKAIDLDNQQNYEEAYAFYCDGLQYFVPLISAEQDATKKRQLREKADCYLRRAEELKCSSYQLASGTSKGAPAKSTQAPATKSSYNYAKLYAMCSSSPQIQAGLQIGHQAELYFCERNLEAAIENFRSSLSVLVPLLGTEPRGERKDLLHRVISTWMQDAERTKALLDVERLPVDDPTPPTVTSNNAIASSYSNCCIQ